MASNISKIKPGAKYTTFMLSCTLSVRRAMWNTYLAHRWENYLKLAQSVEASWKKYESAQWGTRSAHNNNTAVNPWHTIRSRTFAPTLYSTKPMRRCLLYVDKCYSNISGQYKNIADILHRRTNLFTDPESNVQFGIGDLHGPPSL